MSKSFDNLKNPNKINIGGRAFYVSTIPAFYAQRIMLKAGHALADLDPTKIPEDVILELLSYAAFVNENGVKIVLDSIDIINECVSNPKDLIELELAEIKENFGFFFDGSLREVFRPMLEMITQGSETSTP